MESVSEEEKKANDDHLQMLLCFGLQNPEDGREWHNEKKRPKRSSLPSARCGLSFGEAANATRFSPNKAASLTGLEALGSGLDPYRSARLVLLHSQAPLASRPLRDAS